MNRNIARALFVFLMPLALSLPALGQSKTAEAPKAETPKADAPKAPPAARPADVDTVEHIIGAVYDSISGPAGPRDWDRFRSLFFMGGKMIPSGRNPEGKIYSVTWGVEDYVQHAGDYFTKNGFFESPVANRIESWDHIAHVWSTYESRHAKDEKPFARGINSFQLLHDGSRWWILSIYWEGEEAAHPLPDKYLK